MVDAAERIAKELIQTDIQMKNAEITSIDDQIAVINAKLDDMYADRDDLIREQNMLSAERDYFSSTYSNKKDYQITDNTTTAGLFAAGVDQIYMAVTSGSLGSFYPYTSDLAVDGHLPDIIAKLDEKILELETEKSSLSLSRGTLSTQISALTTEYYA